MTHDSRTVEIIAHRGASVEARENTLPAIARAVELGADRIEIDVRRTRDGTLILHHDPACAGTRLCDIESAALPELAVRGGYEIPTLDQVLEQFGANIRWDIELKETGYEEQVAETVLRFLTPDRFVLTSFHDEVLRTLRRLGPQLEVGLILGTDEPRHGLLTRWSELHPMHRAARCGASVLIPGRKFLRWGFLNNVRRFRGKVWVWTVNDDAGLRRLFVTEGVHGIITDDVALALRIRTELLA